MLSLAGTIATPMAAWAQSSVTVYGIMDLAARYVANDGVGSVTSLISGGNATSRLGLRGSEDLGGGLSARFQLEHGISADTGTPAGGNTFWDRLAWVSLASNSLGELRLGRDYVPTYTNWVRFDPFSNVGVAGVGNMLPASQVGPIRSAFASNPNTLVRSNNAVQYLLPANLGGIEGGLMVAAGEGGTAANGQHKLLGLRLGYATGAWVVSGAYDETKNELTGNESFKDGIIAGSYDFGVVKLNAAWRRFDFLDSKQTNILLAAILPVGAAGQLKVSYQKADLSGRVRTTNVADNDGAQLGLGYVHNLSKRTALYASYSRINNDGVATFVVPGGASGLTAGGNSWGVESGVRHIF
ncbi:porin [Pelomonas sp. PFR6]|uniref:Porin n=2 Tax=Roseateles violae TaxID=3058042 RepID=A0ABT8DPY7_9BURK|nr:porin [Pelomonas sp. PFR6]